MNAGRCTNCGAPLGEATQAEAGLRCAYCDALAPPPGSASAPKAPLAQGPSSTDSKPTAVLFSGPVQSGLRIACAFALGWWTVLVGLLVVRNGFGDVQPPHAGIVVGAIVILWTAFLGGRFPASVYAFVFGVSFVVKPLLVPVLGDDFVYSLDSELHLGYFVPGAIGIALGALLVLTLSAEALRARARELRPSVPGAILFCAGVATGLQVHCGETSRELRSRYAPAYSERLATIRGLVTGLESSRAPAQATDLDPTPVLLVRDDEGSNTEAIPLRRVTDFEDTTNSFWLSGDLMQGLRATLGKRYGGRHSGWLPWTHEERSLKHGLEVRYLVLYRADTDARRLDAWLLDLELDQVRLHAFRTEVNTVSSLGQKNLLDMLRETTNGSYRKR